IVITSPTASVINYEPVIYGTADADISGMEDVRIKVSSDSLGSWYLVSENNQANNIWQSSWSWTGLSGLTDQTTYQIVAKVKDKAGNWSAVYSTKTFVYDITDPVAVIASPINDRYYGKNSAESAYYLSEINGTSADAYDIEKVEVRILEDNTNSYWHAGWVVDVSSWHNVGATAWQKATPVPMTDGYKYQVEARAYDMAGNLSAYATNYFYYDEEIPTIALTNPGASYLNSLPEIDGTAADDNGGTYKSGILKTQIAIQENPDGGLWWNGTGFGETSREWIDNSNGPPNWELTGASTPSWVSNTEYKVEVRAMDVARNTSTIVTQQFVYDTQLPVAITTVPANGESYITSLGYIRGTSADSNSNGEIEEVRIRVKHIVADEYWNGIDDYNISDKDAAWFLVKTTEAVAYSKWFSTGTPGGGISFISGFDYEINARAKDKAGNYDTVYSTRIFRYDNQVPISSVTVPSAEYISSPVTYKIEGTSSDSGSAVTAVKVKIRRNSDNYWWSATDGNFISSEKENTAIDVNPWYINISVGLQNNVSYYVQTSAWDQSALIEAYPGGNPVNFWVDYSSPTSAVDVPVSGEYYTELTSLSGTANDATSGIEEAYILVQDLTKGASYWNAVTTAWETSVVYSTSAVGGAKPNYTWELTVLPNWEQDIKYLVVSRGKDKASPNLEEEAFEVGVDSNTFIYDVVKPTTVVTVPAQNEIYGGPGKPISEIRATAFDSEKQYSGGPAAGQKRVEGVYFAVKENWTENWWNVNESTFNSNVEIWYPAVFDSGDEWYLTGASTPTYVSGKEYMLRSRSTDYAGNEEDAFISGTNEILFTYDTALPETAILYPENATHYNSINSINGTASDDIGINANSVEFALREIGGNWWNGSTFTLTSEQYQAANNSAGTDISWSTGTLQFQTNYTYGVKARTVDKGGNIGDATSEIQFVYDVSEPTATITVPVEGDKYKTLAEIKGDYDDIAPGLSDRVEVQIHDEGPSSAGYYNGEGGWSTT
ncbi:MAG: Ig-like domain repeat protein, partial [Elusimicrobiales bacterium]|nr:Ig-like domain repeat protein [Elusimicrobiales bacterium]